MTASGSPFTFGAMIRDPARFIGRRAELAQIMARINGSQAQGSAVVGPRRIGKSSLLYYLAHPRPDEPLRPDAGQKIVYFSAAEGCCETPDAFRASLIRMVLRNANLERRTATGRRLADILQTLEGGAGCSWEMAREVLDHLSYHPVICLDEFEALLTDPFDDRFFTGLRNWANEGKITWVTASARPLQELGKLHGHSSPFFNLLATISLGDLTPVEADQLLGQAEATPQPFSAAEHRMLRKLAGCNPYHLQIVASRLWDGKAARRRAGSAELQRFLCQQPNPPAIYAQRLRPIGWVWLVAALVLVIMGLVFLLAWQAPALAQTMIAALGEGIKKAWTALGEIGNVWGGVVLVTVVVMAIVIAIKRRNFTALWQELRQKLFP
jgi:hypothetical protein